MHTKADSPQFRALTLNHCSVSVRSDTYFGAVGRPLAVIHEDTEARGERDGKTIEGDAGLLVVSGEGWGGRDLESGERCTGGGTPP